MSLAVLPQPPPPLPPSLPSLPFQARAMEQIGSQGRQRHGPQALPRPVPRRLCRRAAPPLRAAQGAPCRAPQQQILKGLAEGYDTSPVRVFACAALVLHAPLMPLGRALAVPRLPEEEEEAPRRDILGPLAGFLKQYRPAYVCPGCMPRGPGGHDGRPSLVGCCCFRPFSSILFFRRCALFH